MSRPKSRRWFLQTVGVAAVAAATQADAPEVKAVADKQPDKALAADGKPFELGLASYTFRKFTFEQTLAMTARLGLKYLCLKSFHLPLESSPQTIDQVAAAAKEAGITLYGAGVIYMNSPDELDRAFIYARRAGMKTIIGVPAYELLAAVNEKVQKYDIKLAIHNHGPGDKLYPTPSTVYEKIKQLDGRIGLCIDVGHTRRAGADPAEAARKYADRLLDVHIKDVSAPSAQGQTVEIGRGVIDIPRFVRTLWEIKYAGVVSFEHEKDAQDPLAGVAESVGYVKGVLAGIYG